MTAHDHRTRVPGCYRCELNEDEQGIRPMTAAEVLAAWQKYVSERVTVGDPDECWEWAGSRSGRGDYGVAHAAGARTLAHRLAFAVAAGSPVPAGMVVMHTCDNPPCCNPGHLVLGTQLDNIRDMQAKGRGRNANTYKTHCAHGHEYTPENTLTRRGGGRICRACANARRARQRDQARERAGGLRQCSGLNYRGHPCGRRAIGSDYCNVHRAALGVEP